MRSLLLLIKNFIYKYHLIFLGCILMMLYFWNRFFRVKISKELPLDLSVLKFFSLLSLCFIFLYIVISLTSQRKANPIIEKVIDWLFIPIIQFDIYLKNISFIKVYYEKGIKYVLKKMHDPHHTMLGIFIIFWLFPRIVLLTALFIDTFIFHKLHYKYYFIWFGLLLFLNRYLKYSLKYLKKNMIEFSKLYIDQISTDYYPGIHPSELEPDYDPNDPDDDDDDDYGGPMSLPFEIFIEFQTNSIIYENITRNIQHIHTTLVLHDKFWAEYIGGQDPFIGFGNKLPENYTNIFGNKIPDNYNKARSLIYKKRSEYGKTLIEEIMKVSLLLESYTNLNRNDEKVKSLKILIYLNYLICWIYILIISLPTLNIFELIMTINKTWILMEDPFSYNEI